MGQSVSSPKPHPDLADFLNFPKEALDSLWTSYNLLGEGWGLNLGEMVSIFKGADFVAANYAFTDVQLTRLFNAFDTDRNGLIDALELFVTIALTSGMDTIDKIYFAFSAYDFDNAGSLSFDEATLLLRSVVQGLGKVSPSNAIFTSPTFDEIEKFTALVFMQSNKGTSRGSAGRITTVEFKNYCSFHPVTSSWLKTVAQYPAEGAPDSLSVPLGNPSVLLGASANQASRPARNPQQTASTISEEDFLVISEYKAAEAAEASKPKHKDIIRGDDGGDEEDEESQEARRAAEAAAAAAAAAKDPNAPVLPSWAVTVDLMKPEEAPTDGRSDAPEDLFEPIWLTGVNTTRVGSETAPPLMHRCVKYANMTLPPVPEALPEGEEAPPVVISTVLLGSAASQLFVMKKEEETGWNQRLFNQHSAAITCLDVHYPKNLLVTAENNGAESRVVIWNLETFAVIKTIPTSHGVKLLDISENGTLLLVVTTDLAATCTMYEIATAKVVFARPLLLGPRTVKDCVTDIRFTGTSAMFAVSSAVQGVTFYVEEGGSFMGPDGLKLYEERSGLYQAIGRPAVGAAVTELCRFEGTDELVAGTDTGQLLVWHGRTVAQLIDAHVTAVNALDFNKLSLTLISGGADGIINIYNLAGHVAPSTLKAKKTPQLVVPRMLQLSATFDILRHDLCSYAIRSLTLSADSRRALVTTSACEVLELALFITPPTAEEVAEAEAAQEAAAAARADAQAAAQAAREAAIAAGEPVPDESSEEQKGDEVPAGSGIPSLQRFLGDDVHKAPILSAHFATQIGTPASVTSLCRMPLGGFASCGADGTVRWWQGAGGNEETGATTYRTTKVVKMDSGCSALDASSATIAVALTSDPSAKRDGSIHLFSLPDMQFITQFSESKHTITTMKFSPEGNLLAAASTDGALYVYQAVEGQWAHKGVCGTASAEAATWATKIDFSADGLYVRAYYHNTASFRLYDVASPAFGKDLTDLTAVPAPAAKRAAPVDGDDEAPPAEDAGPSGPPLELLRGLAWASNTCAYNWDTKGAISLQLPGANDRFNHLLLTATAEGAIAVERVPAVKYAAKKADLDTAKLVTFRAHLGGVSALAFIEEGLRLVSAGAQDGTLRVWKVTYDMDEFEPDPAVVEEAAAGIEEAEEGEEDGEGKAKKLDVIYDSGEDDDLMDTLRMKEHLSRDNNKKRITMQGQKVAAAEAAEAAAVAAALLAAEANLNADTESQSSAAGGPAAPNAEQTRPPPEIDIEVDLHSGIAKWGAHLALNKRNMSIEAARALSAPPSLVPTDELELNWVYGCSSRHTRAAVHYSREGTVVYPAGCLGVIYEKNNNTQAYAMPHSDEITALDVHVTSGLAVSAHKGNGTISACVWNTADGSINRYLDCGVVNGVSAIKFSPDASHVVLTCQDTNHTVLLFSTADGRLRATYRNGPKKPLCLSFSLAETNIAGTAPIRILQGGVNHFKFLTFHPARSTLYGKTGGYGTDVKKCNVNCIGALPLQPGADGGEPTGNEFMLGMADGTIGTVAKGESKVSAFSPVMKGAVTALYVVKLRDGTADEPPAYKIVVGGINGSLKVLDQELQPISEWNLYLNEYGLLPLGRVRGFKSLCVDKLNRKILYATAGGEVGELDLQMGVDVNKGPLVHGHFRDQLHSLCAHPLRQECITAGDDKTLRVWLLDQRKMATSIDLPDIARAATYSPNGHLIVAGLGGEVAGNGRTPRPLRGKVVVISYLQGVLRIVHTAGDAQDTITAVLFTPDGSKLLASSLDGNVYIYDALNNFQLLMSLGGQHKEGVRSMDISESGQYVTTHGEYNEFFVWDLSTAAVVKTADRFEALAVTGLSWSVRQGPFGLNSVGVFPPFSDPADTLTLNQSKDHKLLVVGDSFGALKLFRNPATEYFAPYKKYTCHSPGGISKLAFTVKDQFLLSTGRFDRMLSQWKVIKSSDLPDNKAATEDAPAAVAPEEDYDTTYMIKGVQFVDESLTQDFSESAEVKVQLSAILGTGTGANTLPRALFFGQGDLLTAHGKLPVLMDVGGSGAQRVLFAPSGANPYYNAAQQQVSAFAVAPSGQFAAIGHTTGGNDGASRLVMVSAPSGVQISELSADISGGVTACSFSDDGMVCACLSGDLQHTLYVFRTYSGTWEDATLVSSAQVSAANINLLSFIAAPASAAAITASLAPAAATEALPMQTEPNLDPVEPALVATSAAPPAVAYDLVTAGAGHIKFWRIQGQNLYCTCGDYGADAMNRAAFTAMTACTGGAYFRAQVITGDGEGSLHYWRAGKKVLKTAAHHSAVTALKSFGTVPAPAAISTRRIVTSTTGSESAPSGFVSGSNDKLVIWSTETDVATVTHTFSVPQLLSSCGWSSSIYLSDKLAALNYITSIDNDPRCQRLVVCFASSPVITITKDSRTVQKVTEGHDRSTRVSAVIAHPSDSNTIVTLAEDGMVRVWDITNNTVVGAGGEKAHAAPALIGTLQLQHKPTAATFLNSTTLLVAVSGADTNGNSGSIMVVSFQPNRSSNGIDCKYQLSILSRLHNIGTGALTQLRVAPQYKYLAASCSDGCVYVFRLEGVDGAGNLTRNSGEPSGESKSTDLAESVFIPMGFLLAHPTGAPVVGVDFSADARYARTFGENFAKVNGKVEMNFFDFGKTDGGDEGNRVHAAVKIQDPALLEEMRVASWETVSSPAAVEVRGVNYVVGEGRLGPQTVMLAPSQAFSVSTSRADGGAPLACVSYENGSVGVYRFPMYNALATRTAGAVVDASVHSQGNVVSTFTNGKVQRLVTVGQRDGSIFVWDVQA